MTVEVCINAPILLLEERESVLQFGSTFTKGAAFSHFYNSV